MTICKFLFQRAVIYSKAEVKLKFNKVLFCCVNTKSAIKEMIIKINPRFFLNGNKFHKCRRQAWTCPRKLKNRDSSGFCDTSGSKYAYNSSSTLHTNLEDYTIYNIHMNKLIVYHTFIDLNTCFFNTDLRNILCRSHNHN